MPATSRISWPTEHPFPVRILFVFPKLPKLPGQTRFDLPPLGIIQAAACVPDDFQVSVCDENVEQLDLEADCDLVGISVMLTCQAPRAYELARAHAVATLPMIDAAAERLRIARESPEALQPYDPLAAGREEPASARPE